MIKSLNRLEKDVNSSTQTNLSLLISMIDKLLERSLIRPHLYRIPRISLPDSLSVIE